jgi:hypothetical protein
MMQNYHVQFYERTQLLAHQGKGQSPYFFCSLSLTLLSSRYYVIVFPIKELIMRVHRGLEASISKKIRLRNKY